MLCKREHKQWLVSILVISRLKITNPPESTLLFWALALLLLIGLIKIHPHEYQSLINLARTILSA